METHAEETRDGKTRRINSKFITELRDGDKVTIYKDKIVIVNPNYPVRILNLDGTEMEPKP